MAALVERCVLRPGDVHSPNRDVRRLPAAPPASKRIVPTHATNLLAACAARSGFVTFTPPEGAAKDGFVAASPPPSVYFSEEDPCARIARPLAESRHDDTGESA